MLESEGPSSSLSRAKCIPSSSACSQKTFIPFYFSFSFRFHSISHAIWLHCHHFLSIQIARMQIIFNQNSHFILRIYLGYIFNPKPSLALPALSIPQYLGVLILLQSQLFGSKHPSIRAQGNDEKKPKWLHISFIWPFSLNSNSHTITSWGLITSNTSEFSDAISPFAFLAKV